jgi:protein-disulfide isomerase
LGKASSSHFAGTPSGGTPITQFCNRNPLVILVVAIALLGAGLFFMLRPQVQLTPTALQNPDLPTLGSATASVVITEYSDFQCPFCGKYARETLPLLIEKYVDTGLVRIEWRDFTAFGSESVKAAVAAQAAHEQGSFWEYHNLLFAEQMPMNSGSLNDERLIGFARHLGLDAEQFARDLQSSELAARVEASLDQGIRLGVRGTPAFFINGRMLAGAQPLVLFEQAIDEALSRTR